MRFNSAHHVGSSISLSKTLFAPFRILLSGNIRLVIFTALLAAPTWLLSLITDRVIAQQLSHLPARFAFLGVASSIALSAFVWAIGIPIIFVAVVLPFRTLWFRKSISFGALLEDLTPALQRAYLSSLLSMIGLFLLAAIIVFIVSGVQNLFFVNFDPYEAKIFSIMLTVVISLALFQILTNLLILPFLAIASGLPLREALASTPFLLKFNRIALLIILALGVAAICGANYLFNGELLDFTKVPPIEISCFAAIGWYFAGCLATFSLYATENNTANHFRHMRELASPIVVKHHDVRKTDTGRSKLAAKSNTPVETKKLRLHRVTSAITPQEMQLLLSQS